MTGYGRAQATAEGKTVTIELRSINNRFFDCTVRVPRACTFLEEPIKAAVQQSGVSRGKVEVFVGLEYPGGDSEVVVNDALAERYYAAFLHLSEAFCLPNDLTVSTLARQAEVLTVTKAEENRDALLAAVRPILADALAAYHDMRQSEGARLAADMREKAARIALSLAAVEMRMPAIVAEYHARLTQKMRDLLSGTQIDEARLVAEAALLADRIATDEETVRLKSHLEQMETVLGEGGPVGRKLEFLLQEMNREVNTIGSKAGDLTVTRLIVEMKSDLEKIREQIQNLE